MSTIRAITATAPSDMEVMASASASLSACACASASSCACASSSDSASSSASASASSSDSASMSSIDGEKILEDWEMVLDMLLMYEFNKNIEVGAKGSIDENIIIGTRVLHMLSEIPIIDSQQATQFDDVDLAKIDELISLANDVVDDIEKSLEKADANYEYCCDAYDRWDKIVYNFIIKRTVLQKFNKFIIIVCSRTVDLKYIDTDIIHHHLRYNEDMVDMTPIWKLERPKYVPESYWWWDLRNIKIDVMSYYYIRTENDEITALLFDNVNTELNRCLTSGRHELIEVRYQMRVALSIIQKMMSDFRDDKLSDYTKRSECIFLDVFNFVRSLMTGFVPESFKTIIIFFDSCRKYGVLDVILKKPYDDPQLKSYFLMNLCDSFLTICCIEIEYFDDPDLGGCPFELWQKAKEDGIF